MQAEAASTAGAGSGQRAAVTDCRVDVTVSPGMPPGQVTLQSWKECERVTGQEAASRGSVGQTAGKAVTTQRGQARGLGALLQSARAPARPGPGPGSASVCSGAFGNSFKLRA